VLTVFGDDAHVLSAIEAGATGYLLKDSEPRQVVQWVRTVRDGGSPLSPVIARRLRQRFRAAAAPMPSAPAEPNPLSARETGILRLLAKGLSYVEIGETLGISAHTVTQPIENTYRKLSVRSRGEAVFEGLQLGIPSAPAPLSLRG
jgi:DNA-binding NarL/FixJ family response regulator